MITYKDKTYASLWYQIMGFRETLIIVKPYNGSVIWQNPLRMYRYLYDNK